MAATMTKRLAYRMPGMTKATSRDEGAPLIVFYKMVGGLVAGMAVLLIIMSLMGQISFRRSVEHDPFTGVFSGDSDASRTNLGTVPSASGRNR